MVHVSFDIVERFEPRIPKQTCEGEDCTISRICTAPSLLKALQAIPQSGTVIFIMEQLRMPVIIHAYYLKSDSVVLPTQDQVPDGDATGEMWITKTPDSVRRVDYEVVGAYIPICRDRFGTTERFLRLASFKRVSYQDNWRNFMKLLNKTDAEMDEFMQTKGSITFRKFASNLTGALLEALKHDIREINDEQKQEIHQP